ncbi:Kelch repeat-containing protein [Hyalangium minutum]|uniref:Kelch repeat-containing protein n=1 Tax=Hyalangium minutum TaxID=394096 RepID=UPI0012F8F81B|nr:kelch motif-containing protein [Hyalangium minutum]
MPHPSHCFRSPSSHLLLALTLALLTSCSPPSEIGSAQFVVSVPQALSASISRVSVTASAADFPSFSVDLASSNGSWGGLLGNLAAGSNRSFLAQAFDASGTKLYEGSASGVSIAADQTALVAITLQQVNAPPPFQNAAPVIDSLTASSTSVAAGGSLSLQASAHDPNAGDTLSYAWSSTSGSFSSASAASTSWIAPASSGTQTLTFTATDSRGLASRVSLTINVTPSGGHGDAQISISFNTSPVVASISATASQLAVGQSTSASASASDSDGDSLSYSWSASCAGTWTNASSSSAQFTPSAVPTGSCNNCDLTVSVSDGRGGQTTGTLALCVSPPSSSHVSPVITSFYRSSNTATPGQVLTFDVSASDPEGSALSFSWTATSGSLGTPAHTASSSRITWTAPSCASSLSPPSITATVTNAFNLTAAKSFTVTGLPSCGWTSTGFMTEGRSGHASTLLLSGKVLVTGGAIVLAGRATAEVYDPDAGTWSTTRSMISARFVHTATLLPNGKVLVAGGYDRGYMATAEVYDPATGTWSATGSMATPRGYHTATLLPNGKVLVAGGWFTGPGPLTSVEVYDPASGTWSTVASMPSAHGEHTATLLNNGNLLVAGGHLDGHRSNAHAAVEVYDPAANSWSTTAPMTSRRGGHAAALLANGKVLVTGGTHGGSALAAAEVYDPASGTWSAAGSMLSSRDMHKATRLPNGQILVTGGQNGSYLATAELFDPASGSWSAAPLMASTRREHTATLLNNGKVLISGGYNGGYLTAAELYTP